MLINGFRKILFLNSLKLIIRYIFKIFSETYRKKDSIIEMD